MRPAGCSASRRGSAVLGHGEHLRFSQPPVGTTYVVRGVVELNWTDSRSLVRRRALLTETGKTRVGGGDPAGTSKALCLIW